MESHTLRIQNAPKIFQRKMDDILGKFRDFYLIYIDDILVFSRTIEEHLKHLKVVALTLRCEGTVLSEKKIELCKEKISFLGVEIEWGKDNTSTICLNFFIEKFPKEFTNVTTLQRFLGCVNYVISHYLTFIEELKAHLLGIVPYKI